MAAQRIHTEGNLDLTVDAGIPGLDLAPLSEMGYKVTNGFVGALNAIGVNPNTADPGMAAR